MSVPIIGQQQGIPVNYQLVDEPPMLVLSQGMINITIPINRVMAREIKDWATRASARFEEAALPLTGHNSLAALNEARRQTG